jgi:SAM-dependent methyltransferase
MKADDLLHCYRPSSLNYGADYPLRTAFSTLVLLDDSNAMKEQNSLLGQVSSAIEESGTTEQYVLGDAACELRRLVSQSRLIADITEHVMQRAGIKRGMSVLDCGCGVGDVSFLTARLVGSAGRVFGIDRSVAGIDRARERAAEAGMPNVSFEVVDDLDSFSPRAPLDAVVGRLILMYLREPASILSHFVPYIRPGGLIVFQELVLICAAPSHLAPSRRNVAAGFTIHSCGQARMSTWVGSFSLRSSKPVYRVLKCFWGRRSARAQIRLCTDT